MEERLNQSFHQSLRNTLPPNSAASNPKYLPSHVACEGQESGSGSGCRTLSRVMVIFGMRVWVDRPQLAADPARGYHFSPLGFSRGCL